jgi:hypothetical protein
MAKSGRPPSQILATKKDSLDWGRFNFLENLLVFCANKAWEVEPESGVCFRVNVPKDRNCLCLIFKIDRPGREALVREESTPRPDYLVVYVGEGRCICTIIEMKGRSDKNVEHGVDQIATFHQILKEQVRENLPTKFKPEIQGILLVQRGAQPPLPKIAAAARSGVNILVYSTDRKADLFPYISDKITPSAASEDPNRKSPPSRDFTPLEVTCIDCALPKRLEDRFQAVYCSNPNCPPEEGIFINYLLSKREDYAALFSDRHQCRIGLIGSTEWSETIKASLEEVGLSIGRTIKIEMIS